MKLKELEKPLICAEIHPQHQGSLQDAQRLTEQAWQAGADVVKVQIYRSITLFGNESKKYLEWSYDDLHRLKDTCDARGIRMAASIWTERDLELAESIEPLFLKIAAREGENSELFDLCVRKSQLDILASNPTDLNKNKPRVHPIYTVRKYPTYTEDLSMPKEFSKDDDWFGYSDHTIGTHACCLAIARGAMYIEKHMTLDKSRQQKLAQAHTCSMDLDELKQIISFNEFYSRLT